ncbi:MAG: Mpo1-like protein [Bradymonadia bacterium]
MSRLQSFEEFWPYYLNEHRDPVNRALHFMGTSGAIAAVVTAAVTLNPMFLIAAPFLGYGPAWVGHFIIEKNRPATFTYPLWSLMGDFKMFGLTLTGRLGPHLERAQAQSA